MISSKLEKVLKNIVLTQIIPNIGVDSPSDKLFIKSVVVNNNIYQTLIKMIDYLNFYCSVEKPYICEISFSDQDLVVRNFENNLEEIKTDNKQFMGKNINIIVYGDKFFRTPRVYLYFDRNGNRLSVSPGAGVIYFDRKKQKIIDNCFTFIYKEIISKAVNQIFGPSSVYIKRDFPINIFLFFVQNNSEIKWYYTLMANFWKIYVKGGRLYTFTKPAELSKCTNSDVEKLSRLLLFAMGGAET